MVRRSKLFLVVSASLLAGWIIVLNSFAQDPSSKPTNKNQSDSRSVVPTQPRPAGTPDYSRYTWELPEEYDRTKNPVATSDESIAIGKQLYLSKDKGNCVFCHGETGAGNQAILPRLHRKPADISDRERMSEMTDGELFWKISKGIDQIMPAGERRMTEEERWNLVNYIRTLATKDKQ